MNDITGRIRKIFADHPPPGDDEDIWDYGVGRGSAPIPASVQHEWVLRRVPVLLDELERLRAITANGIVT